MIITTEPCIKRRLWDSRNHPSETAKHYYNVLLAIVLFFIAQFLTCAWDQPFWITGLDFPGQIAAMIFVWIAMWAGQILFCRPGEGLDLFYHRYLKAPTEVLNKHMSIGFTVPLLNLITHSLVGAKQIGMLTAVFVVTGILNSILVYLIAYHVQLASSKIKNRQQNDTIFDVEAPSPRANSRPMIPRHLTCSRPSLAADGENSSSVFYESSGNEAPPLDRFQKHISDVSTLCTLSGEISDSNGPKPACMEGRRLRTPEHEQERNAYEMQLSPGSLGPTRSSGASSLASQLERVPRAVQSWVSQNVFLALSILLFLLVGLPVSFLRHNDLFLDVGFLFTVWLTFTSAQTRTKQHISHGNHRHRRTLTAIATLLNPVLWSSLFLVAYGLAKSGIRNQLESGIVAIFTTKNTISDIIGHHIKPSNSATPSTSHLGHIPIGAGDIATSILNAGIVSWGLKLFEYRRQIVSRGGVTVILTSLLASLLNVVAWPLLAKEMGVRPASCDLSFAARSVTIALGGPVMESLGGDAGVNAVGVVVNGICFQLVAGFVAGGVDSDGLWGVLRKCKDLISHDGLVWNSRWTTGRSDGGGTIGAESTSITAERRPGLDRENQGRKDDRDGNEEMRYSSDAMRAGSQRPPRPSSPAQIQQDQDTPLPPNCTGNHSCNSFSNNGPGGADRSRTGEEDGDALQHKPDEVWTVAAGVTIGINAAAMGTAHLYEQNSNAAPYSALSMTTFGVFTVLFAIRSPLTEWLVEMVGNA